MPTISFSDLRELARHESFGAFTGTFTFTAQYTSGMGVTVVTPGHVNLETLTEQFRAFVRAAGFTEDAIAESLPLVPLPLRR